MEYNSQYDNVEDDTFDEHNNVDITQFVTDDQIEQLKRPLPALSPYNNVSPPRQMALPTPPASSESPEPKRSTTGGKHISQQKTKTTHPKATPARLAALTNVEILKLSPQEGQQIMGERLLAFLVEFDAVQLQHVNGCLLYTSPSPRD